jgi:hypothetical protein
MKDRIPRKLVDELARVYSDPDRAVRRAGGSVVAVDSGRFFVAIVDRLEAIERTLRALVTPTPGGPPIQ